MKCPACGGKHNLTEHYIIMREKVSPRVSNQVGAILEMEEHSEKLADELSVTPDVLLGTPKIDDIPKNDENIPKSIPKSIPKDIPKVTAWDRNKAWRAANREKYNAYMRELMRKKKASKT